VGRNKKDEYGHLVLFHAALVSDLVDIIIEAEYLVSKKACPSSRSLMA
jgi:hypothetical protein